MATWPYFAGIIDGEGFLGVTWSYHRSTNRRSARNYRRAFTPNARIFVGMKRSASTDRLIEALREKAGMGTIWRGDCRGVPHVRLVITGWRTVGKMLRRLRPHMIVKADEADLLIEICDVMRDEMRRIKREKLGRSVGYSDPVILKIAGMADRLAAMHARQMPRKWTHERIRSVLAEE